MQQPATKSTYGRMFRRFADDRRGVAAVEFAMIAPMLIVMFFLSLEVSQAIDANRKVNRLSSIVADVVTQSTKTNPADLKAILAIGQQIMQPYRRSQPLITITGIEVSDKKATVAWSAEMDDDKFKLNPAAKKSTVQVPPSLNIPGTFLVKVKTDLDYVPVISWTAQEKAGLGLGAAFDKIEMGEEYYLRPRMSIDVKCDGC